MKDVPADQKKEVGAKLNDVRTAVTDGIESKKLALQAAKDAKAVEGIDITLPGRPRCWRRRTASAHADS
jgi:phenylalanyl-tRNA synthetase alpha chain